MFIKLTQDTNHPINASKGSTVQKKKLSLKPIAANAELISSQNTKGRKSAIKMVFKKNGNWAIRHVL